MSWGHFSTIVCDSVLELVLAYRHSSNAPNATERESPPSGTASEVVEF
jgi:hypothetical protein